MEPFRLLMLKFIDLVEQLKEVITPVKSGALTYEGGKKLSVVWTLYLFSPYIGGVCPRGISMSLFCSTLGICKLGRTETGE